MPTIPLYYHNQSGVPQGRGVRASPNMGSVQDAAHRQLSESISGLKKSLQDAKDYRTETELKLARDEAWGQFQATLAERGAEDKWAEAWEKQAQGLSKQFLSGEKLKGLSLEARRRVEFEHKAWEQQTRLGVQNLATQRGIEVSKKVGLAAADSAWDNGDEQGASEVYAQMVEKKLLDERLVPQMIEEGRERMQGVALSREADMALNLPKARGYEALESLRERIQAKGEGTDALSDAERVARLRAIEGAQRAMEAGMLAQAREILKGIQAGELGIEAIGKAVESGAVGEVTARALGWSPEGLVRGEMPTGELGRAVRKRAQGQANAELTQARAHAAKFETLRKGIYPTDKSGGTVGRGDIELARSLGQISEADAERLKVILAEQYEYERNSPIYRAEMAKIGNLVVANVKNWDWRAKIAAGAVGGPLSVIPLTFGWKYETDSSPEAWRRRFEAVDKLPLSKQGRIDVVDRLMAVRIADLSDGEVDVSGTIFDRSVSKGEVEVMTDLKKELATHAQTLGPVLMGELFFRLGDAVAEDFKQYKGTPPAEVVEATKLNVKAQVKRAATGREVNELYTIFGEGGAGAINFDYAETGGRAAPVESAEAVEPADVDEDGFVDLGGYNPRGANQ